MDTESMKTDLRHDSHTYFCHFLFFQVFMKYSV